ncbi:MAG: PilZ domain-containing protein [Phycisphaerales bacterium]|nr:PilZ domain-containing protein [Phycisphaerales bacterium]
MDPTPQHHIDRRSSRRISAVHPAKVFDPRAQRYHAAQTCNLSAGGALLKIERSMPVCGGDRLDVMIRADEGTSRLLCLDEAIPSRVVRVMAIDRFSQAVAVQFHAASDAAGDEPVEPVIHTRVRPAVARDHRVAA